MIYSYGVTLPGTYHIEKGIVCQDAHKIIRCADDFYVAAVADGLGSEIHSDIASKIAVNIAVDFCVANINPDMENPDIEKVISQSFRLAQTTIENTARENNHEVDQYDTTLSLVVYIGDKICFGHAGDSGIVVLTADGLYEKVTEQQRDQDDKVYPLFFGENKWVIGSYDKKVASVFLATDGIYETLFPIYIREKPVSIYVSLARYFMDNRSLRIDEVGETEAANKIEAFLNNIPGAQVNDDKTVVVLVNGAVESAIQQSEYYAELDWAELKRQRDEEWRKKAYPDLYAKMASAEADDTSEA